MDSDHRVNILLVDDEPANLIALEAVLESLGQTLLKANSGAEALRCVLNHDLAVILLDVQMPDMSGIDTAATIRERERSRHTPIIFLTGTVKTPEMMFKGYSAGAVDYLMKPIVADVLRAKVEVFVELAIIRKKLQEEVAERARIAGEIATLNTALEERNGALIAANADLEAFGHSVSHDLRTPLRHIHGYVHMLEESAHDKLDAKERRHLHIVRESAQRMTQLIDDLLAFSRIGLAELRCDRVDMGSLVRRIIAELQPDTAGRQIEWRVRDLPQVRGDANLLRQVWTNLAENAIKYTRPRAEAIIEIGASSRDSEIIFHIRDNGVGFDSTRAARLFGVFQRMHSDHEFEGTGVGLANVRKIVQRHSGRTWAEASPDKGATIYFALPER